MFLCRMMPSALCSVIKIFLIHFYCFKISFDNVRMDELNLVKNFRHTVTYVILEQHWVKLVYFYGVLPNGL